METQYRDVKGFPYRVGDDGSVWRQTASGWRLLPSSQRKRGHYIMVTLFGDGKTRTVGVHRLVYEAFVDPDLASRAWHETLVRHRNDVKWDNRLSNLCVGTYNDNATDRLRNRGWRNWNSILSPRQLRIIWWLHVVEGWEQKEIAPIFNVSKDVASGAVQKVHRFREDPVLWAEFSRAV